MAVAESIPVARRQTVVEAIAQALIRYIAEKGLRGGDRLPSERELVEMVGASRLPLREALCVLKGLGIVEARHGKGIYVKRLDIAGVFSMLSPLLRTHAEINPKQIMEVRQQIEPLLATLAAANRQPAHLEVMHTTVAGTREHLHNIGRFIVHDMAFHQEIARSTGNPIFHVIMASITDLVCAVQYLFPDNVEYRKASIVFHQRILQAIEAGDGPKAAQAMREHMHYVEERV
jgi:GntR family transcriptional regulator, transcriptional repressor for pyruvate dehydrogenase complex